MSMFRALLSRSRDKLGDGSPKSEAASPCPASVLVTGAGGRTGSIVVRKLLERQEGQRFARVRAMVRSEASGERLAQGLGDLGGVDIVIGDISDAASLAAAFDGIDSVVICTSAQPQISMASLAKVIVLKMVSFNQTGSRPEFWYEEGQGPEQVDWLGQQAQFEAAKNAGVNHVVLVSSMCGTKPEHFLNTHMGNIVLWKRKAECALVNSGVPYTIIHPGGLLPHHGVKESAAGGRRQLFVGVDDALLEEKDRQLVTREDLAEVCVQCVLEPGVAAGRSFDLGSGAEGQGEPFRGQPGELGDLLATLGGKSCAYHEADAAFWSIESKRARGCSCY